MALRLRNRLGINGASVGAGAVPAEIISLFDAAGSLRFPENNHETNLAGSFGALYQDTTGFPALFDADGAFFAVARIPLDRMHDNRRYRMLGSIQPTSGKRFGFAFYGTDYTTAASRGVLQAFTRSSSGTTINVKSPVVTETDVLIVCKRKENTGPSIDFSIDWYSLTDGAKYAGTPQTGVTFPGITSWIATYFGIGRGFESNTLPTAGTSAEATRVNGEFPGEIAAMGYVSADIADAAWQSIALGADIVTTLGAANLPYLRIFDGTSATYGPPAAATSDSTADCVAVDEENLRPGSQIIRQDTTNYLTVDYIPTGYVYGLQKDQLSRSVTFSGKAGGYTGDVEVRIIGEDGTVHKDWTTVGTIAAGTWSGSVTLERMTQWCWLQARLVSTPSVVAEMREMFGVGYKVAILGQSQDAIFFGHGNLGLSISAQARHRISVSSLNEYQQIAKSEKVFRVGAHPGGDGTVAFAEQWTAYGNDVPLCLVDLSISGTSSYQLIDDADAGRDWATSITAIVDYIGADLSAIVWQWVSSMIGNDQANVLNSIWDNTGAISYDHWLTDGEIDAGLSFVLSPSSRHQFGGASSYSTDAAAVHSQRRDEQISWFESKSFTVGPYVNDLFLDGNYGPHQDTAAAKGSPLLGARMCWAFARDFAIDSRTDPTVSAVAFTDGTKTAIEVTINLPNGGSLTTDGADTAVTGFEVSDDGGSTFSKDGFMAEISGSTVVLTKSTGSWTGGGSTKIYYYYGGPLSYGTLLDQATQLAGQLYETTSGADYAGLGIPVAGSNSSYTVT